MNSLSEQEQIAQLKKKNERLTILCIVFAVIALTVGIYARIQQSIARENAQIAAIEAKRGAEQKLKARLSNQETTQQRKIVDSLTLELTKLRKPKSTK